MKTEKTKAKKDNSHVVFGPRVAGIYVELTKREAMLAALELGAESAEPLTNADLVRLVAEKIVLQAWPTDIANITRCIQCQSFFDFNIDVCPLCGDTSGECAEYLTKDVDDFKFACESEAHVGAPAAEVVEPVLPAEEKAMTNTNTTTTPEAAAEKTQKNGTSAAIVPSMLAGGATAIVKVQPATMVQHTELDLDASIRTYEQLKGISFTSDWDLWTHVRVTIYEPGLWKQRRDEKGEPGRYKSWAAFCNAELNCAPATANTQMAVCCVVTRLEFQQWGSTKATMLIQAPREEQTRIRKLIEGKASTRQIGAALKEAHQSESVESKKERMKGTEAQKEARIEGGANLAKQERKSSDAPWTTKNKAKSAALKEAGQLPAAKVTVATFESKINVEMCTAESIKLESKGKGERVRAKNMPQLPIGEHELHKGVWIRVSWRSTPSGYSSVLEFFRK